METNYTVDYFIKKFEAIPEGLWHIGDYRNSDKSKSCAFGHCKRWDDFTWNEESVALREIFAKTEPLKHIILINDGECPNYTQPSPKQRILAALYDIKKMQVGQPVQDSVQVEQPTYKDITYSLAVLPINETSDLIVTNNTVLS